MLKNKHSRYDFHLFFLWICVLSIHSWDEISKILCFILSNFHVSGPVVGSKLCMYVWMYVQIHACMDVCPNIFKEISENILKKNSQKILSKFSKDDMIKFQECYETILISFWESLHFIPKMFWNHSENILRTFKWHSENIHEMSFIDDVSEMSNFQ